jgi:hypothetical protein
MKVQTKVLDIGSESGRDRMNKFLKEVEVVDIKFQSFEMGKIGGIALIALIIYKDEARN